MVVKQLKASTFDLGWSREVAWEDACVLDRCRGHPHIAQFLDVYMTPHQEGVMYLVMELVWQGLASLADS